METILRCPMPHCGHRIRSGPAAVEAMTDHIIQRHGLPEVSASYHASLLLPIHVPAAA
ncbi:hypothetical protein ACIQKB_03915 [Streptomyces sp. NPDC092046]|uniref:hypothetical protein n=1 Tax=Streptomyces sp. NPDC092046 TaxID=3366009 RepID=UPI00380AB31F